MLGEVATMSTAPTTLTLLFHRVLPPTDLHPLVTPTPTLLLHVLDTPAQTRLCLLCWHILQWANETDLITTTSSCLHRDQSTIGSCSRESLSIMQGRPAQCVRSDLVVYVGTDTAPDPWVKMGGVRLNWGVPYVMGFECLGHGIVVATTITSA